MPGLTPASTATLPVITRQPATFPLSSRENKRPYLFDTKDPAMSRVFLLALITCPVIPYQVTLHIQACHTLVIIPNALYNGVQHGLPGL
jgi:hypothetical protein